MTITHSCVTMGENNTKEWGDMFTKRSWESFYSGLIMVGLVFMVFPVIYFCGATKEKQILPPLIMFLLGLVIFVVSVHFSIKYHKEKTKYIILTHLNLKR